MDSDTHADAASGPVHKAASIPTNLVMPLIDSAIRAYQHAEAIVQSRLYNFLFADSILLLSWAAVFAAASPRVGKQLVLAALALLSTLLSMLWGCSWSPPSEVPVPPYGHHPQA
jgi:hypothetical protein